MQTCFHRARRVYERVFAGAVLLVIGHGALADGQQAMPAVPHVQAPTPIEAGRYLVTIGGCHDCHTNGWAESNGGIPEAETLTGMPIGWRGPWGTTYASNLRIVVADLTEDAWVATLHNRTARPPMPWANVAKLSDEDARAIYRYIQSLGVAGERMPAALDPGMEPSTPYFVFEPVGPGMPAKVAANSGASED